MFKSESEVTQSLPTLCDSMDYSPPGSSVLGISQARIPECIAISSSRGSSPLRDQTCLSSLSCFAGGCFTAEPPGKTIHTYFHHSQQKSPKCSTWMQSQNLKNNRMISVHFQGKPFNITVIQAYVPTSNAEEAQVKRFYEDLQDLLELTPKKRCPFHYSGLECKSRKSRNTWSNRQIWSRNTDCSRAKANRVLPRERTGHSKHPLPTT